MTIEVLFAECNPNSDIDITFSNLKIEPIRITQDHAHKLIEELEAFFNMDFPVHFIWKVSDQLLIDLMDFDAEELFNKLSLIIAASYDPATFCESNWIDPENDDEEDGGNYN
jgi:hypothetical protein